jgi:hypothetical protein
MLLRIGLYMTAAGISIPLAWWLIRSGTRWVWGFSGGEGPAEIINKAITGPMARVDFEHVTVQVRGRNTRES